MAGREEMLGTERLMLMVYVPGAALKRVKMRLLLASPANFPTEELSTLNSMLKRKTLELGKI